MSRRRLIRRCATVVAAVVTTWLALLVGAGQAWAHADLVSTQPANGQRLATAPHEVRLTFTEPVDLGLGAVKVLDSAGRSVRTGALAHPPGDATTVAVPIRGSLRAGVYTVTWQVTSSDSHPVRGAFAFTVGEPSAAAGPDPAEANAGTGTGAGRGSAAVEAAGDDAYSLIGVLSGVVRALAFAGLALCVGAPYFVAVCWPAGTRDPRALRLLRYGGIGLAGATVAALLFYGPYVAELPVGAIARPSLLAETLQTRLGAALVVRLLLLAVLAVGGWLLLRRLARRGSDQTDDRRTRTLRGAGVIAGAAALAATWSAANHSAAGVQVPVAIVADVVHLVAMAVWLGGLVALGVVLLPGRGVDGVRTVVRRFSATAMACVAALAATGLYQAWRQVGSVAALTGTDYGGVLMLKVALVLVILVLAFGARSWVRRHERPAVAPIAHSSTRRRGAPDPANSEVARLRRSVVGEVGVAGMVLILTAVLVNTETGRTALAKEDSARTDVAGATALAGGDARGTTGGQDGTRGAAEPGATPTMPTMPTVPGMATIPYDTGGPGGQGTIQLVVQPPKVGVTTMHLATVGKDGRPVDPVEISAAAKLTEPDVGPINLKVAKASQGHYISLPIFPLAGQWTITVTIRTSDVDQVTVTAPVDIG
ncbi:copper resistance protein CopC [Actinopolymorpha sp. B17G11]|uniref:copper resistance protein CopC n=1 Tax=Actinopolymorpha sp. B17G11 TaxID=3160861 RepID=UPI0032E37EE7